MRRRLLPNGIFIVWTIKIEGAQQQQQKWETTKRTHTHEKRKRNKRITSETEHAANTYLYIAYACMHVHERMEWLWINKIAERLRDMEMKRKSHNNK